MAIVAKKSFNIRVSYFENDVESATIVQATGNGEIEGEKIMVPLVKDIPYDGTMTLADLVATAKAALEGKTADVVAAVAAAPLPKEPAVVVEDTPIEP
jgi:hypothetical protein